MRIGDMRRTEIISAIVLVAFGLVLIAVIIPKYVAGGGQQVDLSPAFMPYVAAGIITTVMAIFAIVKLTRRTPQDDEPTPMSPAAWLFIGLVAAIFVATYVVMSLFGFVLGGLVVVGSFLALARTRPIPLVVITVSFTVAVWLFVEKLMGIPLP